MPFAMLSVINYDAVDPWFSEGINDGIINGMDNQNPDYSLQAHLSTDTNDLITLTLPNVQPKYSPSRNRTNSDLLVLESPTIGLPAGSIRLGLNLGLWLGVPTLSRTNGSSLVAWNL